MGVLTKIQITLSADQKINMMGYFKSYIEDISINLLEETELSKKRLKNFLHVLMVSSGDFFRMTRHIVFPYLFINQKTDLMEDIANCLRQDLATILIDECAYIFGHILMENEMDIDVHFHHFIKLANLDAKKITMGQLFKSCLLVLTKTIALGLGSDDKSLVIQVK